MRSPFQGCLVALRQSLESRSFVHSQVVSLVAVDQILRLLHRGADGVGLELGGGLDLLFDCSTNVARFRVPLHMIPNFEACFIGMISCRAFASVVAAVGCGCDAHDPGLELEVLAGNRPLRSFAVNGPGWAINWRAASTCSHTFHNNTPRTRPFCK